MTSWNPLEQRETRTFDLRKSNGTATATFRPWSARERIAYEDALTTRLMDLGIGDDDDRETVVKLGTLKLCQLALTIESVTGFPDECEIVETVVGDDGVARDERRRVPFNPKDERCLAALDDETYAELKEYGELVQTPPGEEIDDDTLDALRSGELDEGSADPTPTPSTSAETPTAESPANPPSVDE